MLLLRLPVPSAMDDDPQCELLGPFALVVQASMGGIAILSLVYKRNHESPRRPWWIWFFDVLKQVFGAAGLHMLNLLMSIMFSQSGEPDLDKNPCTWYFLNILVDTTIGVPVLWFFLFIVHTTAFRLGVTEIVSGKYGHPPKWRAFFKQAALYLTAMVLMKCVLYAFFWWMPRVDALGDFLISWTNFDPRVQVAFVMLAFPLVMNTIQYYLVDTIIQASDYHKESEVPESQPDYGAIRDLPQSPPLEDDDTLVASKLDADRDAAVAAGLETANDDSISDDERTKLLSSTS